MAARIRRDISVVSQPVAVLREDRGDPDGIVDPEAHEPAEQQVMVHLIHELPLGPDRAEDLQQAGPDQPFRRDGGTALPGVELVEFRIRETPRIVDDCLILRSGCRAGMRSSRST